MYITYFQMHYAQVFKKNHFEAKNNCKPNKMLI